MSNNKFVKACDYPTQSCTEFMKINDLIIEMVNKHYFDLQMYANFVLEIDNDPNELSKDNNFLTKINKVKNKYTKNYPDMPLFTDSNMSELENLVIKMMDSIKNINISPSSYLSNVYQMVFFGSGHASPAILLKISKKIDNDKIMPLIVKFVPLQFPHHNEHLPSNDYIKKYIEYPSTAIYLKEAWMYCFSKNVLSQYTPTFTCISNCYIINGFPIKNLEELKRIYQPFAGKLISAGKNLPYKKWFDILLTKKSDIKDRILASSYGCFEMQEIEGTLDDIIDKNGTFTLSLLFEYLYTKVISAHVGRIIFTDDHFGNVAYITVDYTRKYSIKCNGIMHYFYMPPGKMVQFIDLERYVFNYSQYNIYTNTALKSIKEDEYKNTTPQFNRVRSAYKKNNYIFDKSLSSLLDNSFNKKSFKDEKEYLIMLNILNSHFVHDVKTFCQIMETNLPEKYLNPQSTTKVHEYYIDLDDVTNQTITLDMIKKNI